jgi:hypothetical protein
VIPVLVNIFPGHCEQGVRTFVRRARWSTEKPGIFGTPLCAHNPYFSAESPAQPRRARQSGCGGVQGAGRRVGVAETFEAMP